MTVCQICGIEHGVEHSDAPDAGMRLMAVTFPKSGTNLLIQLMGSPEHLKVGFPVLYDDIPITSGNEQIGREEITLGRTYQQVEAFKGTAFGHVPWSNEMIRSARVKPTVVILLVRDPRDVIVSHYAYVRRKPEVPLNFRFSDGSRLSERDDPIRDLIELAPAMWWHFVPWLQYADYVVRFESLIADPLAVSHEIFIRAGGQVLGVGGAKGMVGRIDPSISPTFRKGVAGDWVNHFTSAHRQRYGALMSRVHDRLGYP